MVSTSRLDCGLYLAHRPTKEVNTFKIERGQYLKHNPGQYLTYRPRSVPRSQSASLCSARVRSCVQSLVSACARTVLYYQCISPAWKLYPRRLVVKALFQGTLTWKLSSKVPLAWKPAYDMLCSNFLYNTGYINVVRMHNVELLHQFGSSPCSGYPVPALAIQSQLWLSSPCSGCPFPALAVQSLLWLSTPCSGCPVYVPAVV